MLSLAIGEESIQNMLRRSAGVSKPRSGSRPAADPEAGGGGGAGSAGGGGSADVGAVEAECSQDGHRRSLPRLRSDARFVAGRDRSRRDRGGASVLERLHEPAIASAAAREDGGFDGTLFWYKLKSRFGNQTGLHEWQPEHVRGHIDRVTGQLRFGGIALGDGLVNCAYTFQLKDNGLRI